MASSSQVRRSRREQLQAQRVAQAQKERRNRVLFVSLGLVVLIAVIIVAVWGIISATSIKGGTDTPPNSDPAANGIYLAPANASLPTLEIYSDFNCPHCQSANATLGPTLEQMVSQGKANVLYHNMSFLDATSKDAAIAAACADFQGMYEQYANQLYLNQSSSGFAAEVLTDTIPANINMTGDKLTAFQTCVSTQATGKFVQAEAKYASDQKVNSTPTFIFNGQVVNDQIYNTATGTYDPDKLRTLVGM